jgi:hypothetical protein
MNEIEGLDGNLPAWTGVNDRSDERKSLRAGWKLNYGDRLLPDDSSIWVGNAPEDVTGKDCVTIGNGKRLNDHPCSSTYSFVCEMPFHNSWIHQSLPLPSVFQVVQLPGQTMRRLCAFEAGRVRNCDRFLHHPANDTCLLVDCWGITGVNFEVSDIGWQLFQVKVVQ